MSFLQTGPDEAARQVEQNMAQFRNPRAAFETTFRFQYHANGNWQWVADTEVEEANGYAVLAAFATAQAKNCELIRDIFGNPHSSPAIDSAWLGWNDRTILKVSQAIYEERAFDRLPILADALEDAGCNVADIVDHCRGPGPHVRGCWVIDLLLDKE
jgi:hypothetical protein